MIWFTSDLHLNHDREFIWGPRGFKSVDEANRVLIDNWRFIVKPDDDIYVLGDFFLGRNYDYIENVLNRLPGKIHVIIGNHDTPAKIEIYKAARNVVEVVYATMVEYNGRRFYLSHYPTETSSLEASPSRAIICLCGHTHYKQKFYGGKPYIYNVSVDAHNNWPVCIEEIIEDFNNEVKACYDFLED